jgi:hypothetical protein
VKRLIDERYQQPLRILLVLAVSLTCLVLLSWRSGLIKPKVQIPPADTSQKEQASSSGQSNAAEKPADKAPKAEIDQTGGQPAGDQPATAPDTPHPQSAENGITPPAPGDDAQPDSNPDLTDTDTR